MGKKRYNFKARSFRMDDPTAEELERIRKQEGKTWNLLFKMLAELYAKQKK